MNHLERRMVSVLEDLRENHHVCGIKAEFEAEGTRLEEALRLKEVVTKADLDLTIKIGGCEALKDIYDSRSIGVTRIVAPMIESAYALSKFLACAKKAFPADEREGLSLVINIETKIGFDNFNEMMHIPEFSELDGIVMGRVDMVGSLGMKRDDINHAKIFEMAKLLAVKCQEANKEFVIGGGVSAASLEFFRNLPANSLSRYETRKVIFSCPSALDGTADKGILKAVGFELLWLKNKRDFYGMIFDEDKIRIEMLQSRYDRLITDAGGYYE